MIRKTPKIEKSLDHRWQGYNPPAEFTYSGKGNNNNNCSKNNDNSTYNNKKS